MILTICNRDVSLYRLKVSASPSADRLQTFNLFLPNSDKSLKSVLLLLRLYMIKQKLGACTWFVQALKMMLSILSMPMF